MWPRGGPRIPGTQRTNGDIRLATALASYLEANREELGTVAVTCAPELVAVVDPFHLTRILDNYLTNAFKYGEPPICIEAERVGDFVELRVRDHGLGVPPEFVSRGVDTLDELGRLLTDLKFEIIVRPDVGTGADLELFAPTKGRGQGEYWPLSWPELRQSMFDFETLIEEEAEAFRQSIEEPDNPPVILPTLASSQRLHLIQGRPWKYALGDFMADARDGECWFAPERYTRGDLLLSVLKTQPPVLLCLERARAKPKGPSINVGTRGLYFHRLVPVHVIEQRAGVTLPHAPATLRKKVAAAVLDAIATELSNPVSCI